MQAVTSQGFLWLLAAVLCVSEACLQQCKRVRGLLEEGLKGGRIPRTQWTPLLQGMQEAAQAVSEVSHGRWAKLLASRSAPTRSLHSPNIQSPGCAKAWATAQSALRLLYYLACCWTSSIMCYAKRTLCPIQVMHAKLQIPPGTSLHYHVRAVHVASQHVDHLTCTSASASCNHCGVRCRAKANNEMRVGEVKQMLQLCTDFSSMAEGFGCRPVASVRTAVQLQCKSCLDHLHHHTLTNLTGRPSSIHDPPSPPQQTPSPPPSPASSKVLLLSS